MLGHYHIEIPKAETMYTDYKAERETSTLNSAYTLRTQTETTLGFNKYDEHA